MRWRAIRVKGDRDLWGSVEEAAAAYRMLAKGELAILPNGRPKTTRLAGEGVANALRSR
jgi:hypothetical protein